MTHFSEIFYLTFISATFAFFALVIRQCYRCRISEINCCGFVVKRNAVLENEEVEMKIEHHLPEFSPRISSLGNPLCVEEKV